MHWPQMPIAANNVIETKKDSMISPTSIPIKQKRWFIVDFIHFTEFFCFILLILFLKKCFSSSI